MRLDNLETKQKTTSNINEGMRPGDLEHLVHPYISVNDFEPKSGSPDNIVVVTFYTMDNEPAEDLASFIERGSHKILDTEVSPAPDDEGRYLVFVEMTKDNTMFDVTKKILNDISKLVNIEDWEFKFYGTDRTIKISAAELK